MREMGAMNNSPEEWKDIEEFPKYEVSSFGRIRRKTKGTGKTFPGKILRPGRLKRGHAYVNLYDHTKAKQISVYVHRLVAKAFIGSPPTPEHQVAHWDGNAQNNFVENLRWATNKENCEDSVRLGRSKRPSGIRAKRSKLSIESLYLIKDLHEQGYSQREMGCMLGVSHRTIGLFLSGKSYREEYKAIFGDAA